MAVKAYLNIFELVELFKIEQRHIEASIPYIACCRRNSEKGPTRKRKEERIKKIEDKFDAGVNETGVDETGVDQKGVDETSSKRKKE